MLSDLTGSLAVLIRGSLLCQVYPDYVTRIINLWA